METDRFCLYCDNPPHVHPNAMHSPVCLYHSDMPQDDEEDILRTPGADVVRTLRLAQS